MREQRETWEIVLHEDVAAWYLALCETDANTAAQIEQALDALAADGPTLGRPLVDKIQGSRIHNLKELRPGSAGTTEIRILFVFDDKRRALVLIGGDKSGQWREWYRTAIKQAEQRYGQLITDLNEEDAK